MFLDILPHVAHATTVPLEVGVGTTSAISSDWPLLNYIGAVYTFLISAIGIAAAAMIMFNGLRWAAAAGNPEQISTAKSGITGAIVGLILALASYVILNTLNPALVNLQNLDMTNITFVEPVTSSVNALKTGNISDDETLIHYMDVLPADQKAVLNNEAGEPYITQSAYTALGNALRMLADPTSPYYGMKLTITSANRSIDKQNYLWACYQKRVKENTCPDGCGSCNVAAQPGTSNHGYGRALDVTWTNTGSGKYQTVAESYISSSYESTCMATKGSSCDANIYTSIQALNTMMQSAGFGHLCIEWWHEQVGGSDSLCAPGTYK